MDVTVAVCTFGDDSWVSLAQRAIRSAQDQAHVVHVHGRSLHEARNTALELIATPWVVYLDADDELEPGYVEAISSASGDLRVPRVRYVRRGRPQAPVFPRVAGHTHDCTGDCFPEGNWCVIGTAVRVDMLRVVGGWRDYAWAEDWDLWQRCWIAGASFERVPAAVYRAVVRRDGRLHGPARAAKLAEYERIRRTNFPELYEVAA